MKTKVQFYMEPDGNLLSETIYTPLAVFPDLKERNGNVTCYAHTGQHSECTPGYTESLQPATPDQYNDLKAELESIGYKLIID